MCMFELYLGTKLPLKHVSPLKLKYLDYNFEKGSMKIYKVQAIFI